MESTTGAESAASLGGAGGLETPPGAGAPPPATLLRVLCLLVAAGLLIPGLLLLSPIWERSEFFSHGYLIPMIAVFLLFRQRRELLRAFREGVPGRFGAWAVLGAVPGRGSRWPRASYTTAVPTCLQKKKHFNLKNKAVVGSGGSRSNLREE